MKKLNTIATGSISKILVASTIFTTGLGISAIPVGFAQETIGGAAQTILFTEREPDRTDEQINELIRNYQKKLVKAINTNSFADVEPYLYPGSSLYESQKKLVADLSSRNMKEHFIASTIYGYFIDEDEFKAEVSETIEVEYSDQDIRTKEYHWIYTVKPRDGQLLLSDIEQWTTFRQDIDRRLGSVKTEGYYAEELLNHYPKLLETAINTLDITDIRQISKNGTVVQMQKELISDLRNQGSDYSLSSETIYEDWDTLTFTLELSYQFTDKGQNKRSGSRKINVQLDEIWNHFQGYGVIRYLEDTVQEHAEAGSAVVREFSKIHSDLPESMFKVYGKKDSSDFYSADKIEVYQEGPSGQLVQELLFDPSRTGNGKSLGLALEDMNFDGYLDIRIQADTPAGPNVPYYYWLWDPKASKYIPNTELESITSPEFDPDDRTIQSWVKEAPTLYSENTYRYIDNSPILIKRVENEMDPESGIWRVTVKELQGRQLVVTKQYEETGGDK